MHLPWSRQRSDASWLQAPFNPRNGHAFICHCSMCVSFWDTAFGLACYEEWRTYMQFRLTTAFDGGVRKVFGAFGAETTDA
jgi:hypothetical protein